MEMSEYLYEANLKLPLLAFAFAYYIFTVLWAEIRRNSPHLASYISGMDKKLLIRGRACRLLTMGFTTIVLCSAAYPYAYNSFIPIHFLDIPLLNLVGISLLATSLIWTVLAQINFDEDLEKVALKVIPVQSIDMTLHSKRLVTGYFIMFLGITLTLASVMSIVLFGVACGILQKNRL